MGYGVPHFGTDHDVMNTQDNIKLAEQQQGHSWTVKDPPKDPPRNYFVPHFGTDSDINDTEQSLKLGEAAHHHTLSVDD